MGPSSPQNFRSRGRSALFAQLSLDGTLLTQLTSPSFKEPARVGTCVGTFAYDGVFLFRPPPPTVPFFKGTSLDWGRSKSIS